jgi:SAM-dependent methyltransferase
VRASVATRSTCRVCGGDRLTGYLRLPAMPLTDQMLRASDLGSEFRHDIDIHVCESCGQSQTLHDVDVRDYYHDYRYTVSNSGFATRFMQRLAQSAWQRFELNRGDSVVEVGSGDGLQLECFAKLGARVFGFEPSAPLNNVARGRGIPVSQCLFDHTAHEHLPPEFRPVRVVLLTYTFDHLPDPLGFLRSAAAVLDPQQGILLIEVHDLEKIIARREFCLFEHEHTIYNTAATLQRLLRRGGFQLLGTDLLPLDQRRGNSLLVAATPVGSNLAREAVPDIPVDSYTNPAYLARFGKSVMTSLDRFAAIIRAGRDQGLTFAGYGAGGRGVMTLAAVAKPGDFQYVCDQNTSMHGLFTPVSHIPVMPPEELDRNPVDQVVVFSFGYMDEIRQRCEPILARGGKVVSMLDLL